MISANLSPVETVQKHQFLSFVEGSAATAPDPSSYPLHVLGVDHNLNHVDGGDPTNGFDPWVTDILVYPTSEYWETLLNGNRVRPYLDLSISEYNTLRLPSAVHDYDLYADTGKFYEDVVIDGTLMVGGITLGGNDLVIPGDLSVLGDADIVGTLDAETLKGDANTTAPLLEVTADLTFDNNHTGYVYHCKPSGSNVTITLPQTSTTGVTFMVNNCLAGKTVTFANLTNARGTVLGEQFSAATIYWDGSAWYGIGDLV
tara:strand:- start:73 stop:846 length:774 start_codon:yes stop_codon:yes gene_type:complete